MLDYIEILEQLQRESSTNKKIEILSSNKENIQVKNLLQLALSKKIVFNVKEFTYTPLQEDHLPNSVAYFRFMDLADKLSFGILTGNAALDEISKTFSAFGPKQSKWFERILKKDLASISLGRSNFDKAYGTSLKFKVQLAMDEKEINRIVFPAYLDIKRNGVRTLFIIDEVGVVNCPVGRSGLEIPNYEYFSENLKKLNLKSVVLDGEVCVPKKGGGESLEDAMTIYSFDRTKTVKDFTSKTGRVSKGWSDYQERLKEVQELILASQYCIFDVLQLDEFLSQGCTKTLKEKLLDLDSIQDKIEKSSINNIYCTNLIRVNSVEEAKALSLKWISENFEGGMLKNSGAVYEFRRSPNIIKIKENTGEIDAKIVGYTISKEIYTTDGKLDEPQLGALLLEYEGLDGKTYQSECGTGNLLNKDFKIEFAKNPEKYIGQWVILKAQRFSEDNILICPSVICLRDSK